MAVLSSPIVRNAVAAALASAAAALLYKKQTDASDTDHGAEGAGAELRDDNPASAKRSRSTVVRQKAAAAVGTVSKAAKAAVSKAAGSDTTQATKPAISQALGTNVEHATRAAVSRTAKADTGGGRQGRAVAPIDDMPSTTERRQRKKRSDAGMKRKPTNVSADVVAPQAEEFTSIGDTEISPIAITSAGAGAGADATAPEIVPGSASEQTAEAHPS